MKQKRIFLICILAVFILIQPAWQIAGISVKTWLVWLAAAAGGILRLYEKKDSEIRRTPLVYMLGLALLWNVLQLIWGAVTMAGCEESSLLTVALLLLFYLVYTRTGYKPVYAYTVLFSGTVLYGGLLWNFLADPSYTVNLQPLLDDKQALCSLLLLISAAAGELYCREKDQTKRIFCLIMAACGYFLLFLVRDIIGMALLGISFPISILAHKPERKYIQRIMQLLFLYFFMMSNMCLLTNYTSLIKTEVSYSLENSIYLDLIIAIAGSIFFAWWDRLPQDGGKAPERKSSSEKTNGSYEKFRLIMGWILAGCGIAFVLLLLPGSHAAEADLQGGAALVSLLSEELCLAAERHRGAFGDAAEWYGIPGAIWLICIAVLAAGRMAELIRQKNTEPETVVFFVVFLLQAVFYGQQPVSTPVYLLFAAMALHGRPERARAEKIVETKNVGTDRKGRKRREHNSGKQTEEEDLEIWDMESFFADGCDADGLYVSHEDTGSADAGEHYQHDADVRRDQGKRAKRSGRLH
ncbi:MAG: hypothetical protein HDR26_04820 [Lachnospiraceae bacterium]|nr:hypothetical protein [Lachnospiraceae bacterium]